MRVLVTLWPEERGVCLFKSYRVALEEISRVGGDENKFQNERVGDQMWRRVVVRVDGWMGGWMDWRGEMRPDGVKEAGTYDGGYSQRRNATECLYAAWYVRA